MAPPPSTVLKSSYSTNRFPESHADPATPNTCALCGGAVRGGEKFLTLSIDGEGGCRGPSTAPTSTHGKYMGSTALPITRAGTRRFSGQRKHGPAASATCHLKCLRCTECGFPLSGPPRGVAQDDRGLLFDKGGAAAAYVEAQRAQPSSSSGIRAFTLRPSLLGRRDERWAASIFKNFVAHATCAERVCAACGEVIHPGEQQVSLPRTAAHDRGKSNNIAGPFCRMESRPDNSACRPSPHNVWSSNKPRSKTMISQHVSCTRCSTCGLSLSTNVSHESSASIGSPTQRHQNISILLDDNGRPHHASCMACCCCRRPLFGRYEVHRFFGYLRICQQALEDDPPLLPFPEGRAAALFGAPKTRGKTSLQKTIQSTSATQHGSTASSRQLEELVTPVNGGLCCSWCQSRVPCCISCERRCSVYTDANGQQFLPRALASKAKRAAELAAAISLGHVTPPQPGTSDHAGRRRKEVPASSIEQSQGFTGGAIRQVFPSTTTAAGQRSDAGGHLALRNRLVKTQSSHTMKTAETQGVLCGHCASLSVVETEDHLRSCVDTVLQFFEEEGIIFSTEMIHLQHLMNQVSKESEETRAKLPTERKSGTVKQTVSTASAASSAVGSRQSTGLRITSVHTDAFGIGRKKQVSKEVKPLQQVEAAGLRIDLVDFDSLNDGQLQHNARSFLSLSVPSSGWFSTIKSSSGRLSASGGTWESASMSVAPHYPSRVTQVLISGCAPPSVVPPTSNKALAGVPTNDAGQHQHPASDQTVAREPSEYPEKRLHALNSDSTEKCRVRYQSHALNSAVGGWKGHQDSRLLFGRCHVVEVSLVVAADAAPQFDKQVRAMQRRNPQRNAGVGPGGSRKLGSTGWAPATSRASKDMALKHEETAVPRDTFAEAAACAASLEVEDQLSRWSTATKRDDEGDEQGETNVAVTAGALLLKGSFAGGLVKTASGLHTQGLCVRVVKRVVVVGALPRIVVLQHLAHEFIHAYLACKQKVIEDLPAEEGACNLAAAAVLLRTGADLMRLLRDSCGKPITNASADISKDGLSPPPCYPIPAPRSRGVDRSFELLLLRYRLWKMVESSDEVYGLGYRRCLQTVGLKQLTFGEFVLQLLKGWRTSKPAS